MLDFCLFSCIMVYMMMTKQLEEDFTRTAVFPAVTPISNHHSVPMSILEKKIAKLEEEAAIRMAIDTFLDCSDTKVKVRRMAKPRPSEMTFSGLRQRGTVYNLGAKRANLRNAGFSKAN